MQRFDRINAANISHNSIIFEKKKAVFFIRICIRNVELQGINLISDYLICWIVQFYEWATKWANSFT